jgi:hypothetical protein
MYQPSFYEFAIAQVANKIRSISNQHDVEKGYGLTAFKASEVLAVVFCKDIKEIAMDIAFWNKRSEGQGDK